MPAVGIDQNALPLLFGEAEIGDAGGEHGLLLPLPRETDEFPAHGDKAVIRLFFVAFHLLVHVDEIVVDKRLTGIRLSVFGGASARIRNPAPAGHHILAGKTAHESGDKPRDPLQNAHGDEQNFEKGIPARLHPSRLADAIEVPLPVLNGFYVGKFRIGEDGRNVERIRIQPVNFGGHIFHEIVIRIPAHPVRVKKQGFPIRGKGGIFVQRIPARHAFIVPRIPLKDGDAGGIEVGLHGGEHLPPPVAGDGHKIHFVGGHDMRLRPGFVVQPLGIDPGRIVDGKGI